MSALAPAPLPVDGREEPKPRVDAHAERDEGLDEESLHEGPHVYPPSVAPAAGQG
jgi:hypothetical protein